MKITENSKQTLKQIFVSRKKNITRKIFRLVLGAQPTPRPFMFTKSGYYLKLTKNRLKNESTFCRDLLSEIMYDM